MIYKKTVKSLLLVLEREKCYNSVTSLRCNCYLSVINVIFSTIT